MDWNLMDMEEEHQQAFGKHTGINEEVRDTILSIKDNDDDINELLSFMTTIQTTSQILHGEYLVDILQIILI